MIRIGQWLLIYIRFLLLEYLPFLNSEKFYFSKFYMVTNKF